MKRLRASSNVEEDMEEMRMEGKFLKNYYWKIPHSYFPVRVSVRLLSIHFRCCLV